MTLEEHIKDTEGKSYTERVLLWFQRNIGKPVKSEDLASIPGKNGKPISHNIRRIFELRDEKGFDIINHKDERGIEIGLKVDEWVLVSTEANPKNIRERGVNKRIMFEVFTRDNFQCQTCGRTPDDDDPFKEGRKIKLHVGHINPHKSSQVQDNTIKLTKNDFITMCNVCNEGLSNKEFKPITLMDRVINSSEKEKLEIFNYLKNQSLAKK